MFQRNFVSGAEVSDGTFFDTSIESPLLLFVDYIEKQWNQQARPVEFPLR